MVVAMSRVLEFLMILAIECVFSALASAYVTSVSFHGSLRRGNRVVGVWR